MARSSRSRRGPRFEPHPTRQRAMLPTIGAFADARHAPSWRSRGIIAFRGVACEHPTSLVAGFYRAPHTFGHRPKHAWGGHPGHDLRSSTIGPSVVAPHMCLRAAVGAVPTFARTSMFARLPAFPPLPHHAPDRPPCATTREKRRGCVCRVVPAMTIHPFDGAAFCGGERCCQANRQRDGLEEGIVHAKQ